MTQAQRTHTGPSMLLPAAVAALAAAAALTVAILATGNFSLVIPQAETNGGTSTELIQSGRDWEAQRRQQMPAVIDDNMVDYGVRFHAGDQTFQEKVEEARGW